jgi:hypothetical protein
MWAIGLAAWLLVASGAVAAQPYDMTLLDMEGAWSVEHGYDARDGRTWCTAETVNAAGQVFGVAARDDGAATVFVADPGWLPVAGRLSFTVMIDDVPWTIEGATQAGGVSVPLEGNEGAGLFLAELAAGEGLFVGGGPEAPRGRFSLAGAEAALGRLAECWARILPREVGGPPG